MGEWAAQVAGSWAFGVFLLLAGLAVGSFLNVCIHRLPAGKSLVWPPSHCPACLAPIAWYDNIPVVSYFVLRGRCRRCGAGFSARYMLVEAATGLVFFGYWLAYFRLGVRQGADHLAVYAVHVVLLAALLVSGVIDLERKEIYTSVTNLALAVGVVGSFLWPRIQEIGAYDRTLGDIAGWPAASAAVTSLIGAAVGGGLVYLVRVLGTQAFRKEAMGMGDVYLLAAVGAVLGWEATLLVLVVGCFLALPYGFWQVFRRGSEPQEETPQEAPPRPPMPWGALLSTVAGFGLLLWAALAARPEWDLRARVLLGAALAAFGLAAWRAEREERRQMETDTPLPRAPESHEVPFGPFLGLAAAVVMLIQDAVMAYFRSRGLWA